MNSKTQLQKLFIKQKLLHLVQIPKTTYRESKDFSRLDNSNLTLYVMRYDTANRGLKPLILWFNIG